jgi:ATP-dependent Lon protease
MSQQTPVERTPKNKETNEQKALPVLPVRDTVLFPHAVLPLTVGRESSVQLINSLGEDKTIIVVAQREARVDAPQPSDLYTVGTSAVVHKVVKMPNQSLFVFAEGLERVRLAEFTQLTPFMSAHYHVLPEGVAPSATSEIEALQRNVLTLFQQIVAGSPTLSDELSTVAMNIDEPGRLVDFIASSLPSLSTPDKQDTLETLDIHVRLEKINQHLAKELEVQQLRNKIQSEVQDRVQQTQREYYLREQMKAIQKELGEQDEGQRDVEDLKKKIEEAGMPDEVKKEALKELGRLSRMSPMAAGASVGEDVWSGNRDSKGEGNSRSRPLRSRKGERPDSRLPFRSPSEAEYERADFVLCRASRGRQNVIGEIDRSRAGPQVCTAFAGRRSR